MTTRRILAMQDVVNRVQVEINKPGTQVEYHQFHNSLMLRWVNKTIEAVERRSACLLN